MTLVEKLVAMSLVVVVAGVVTAEVANASGEIKLKVTKVAKGYAHQLLTEMDQ